MAEAVTPTTAAPTPAAAKPGGAPAAAPPADATKPSVADREREERTRALAAARRKGDELTAARSRITELEAATKAAQEGGGKEVADLKRLIREDPHAAFRALGAEMSDVTKALLRKSGKADPKDAAVDELRRELADLKTWRAEAAAAEERRSKESEASQTEARTTQIFGAVLHHVEECLSPWRDKTPETPAEMSAAAGDELFVAGLKEDPAGWRRELAAFAAKYPQARVEDARRYYGASLLRQVRSRASLRFVGALQSEGAETAPTSEPGGKQRADVPRTAPRKTAAPVAKAIPTTGLSLRERDELKQAQRREMAARVGRR